MKHSQTREILLALGVIFRMQQHLARRLNRVERTLIMASTTTQQAIARIETDVAGIESATDAVLALLESVIQQIRDSKDDPAELDALADRLEAKKDALAKAVTDNTPAQDDGSSNTGSGTPDDGSTPPDDGSQPAA